MDLLPFAAVVVVVADVVLPAEFRLLLLLLLYGEKYSGPVDRALWLSAAVEKTTLAGDLAWILVWSFSPMDNLN